MTSKIRIVSKTPTAQCQTPPKRFGLMSKRIKVSPRWRFMALLLLLNKCMVDGMRDRIDDDNGILGYPSLRERKAAASGRVVHPISKTASRGTYGSPSTKKSKLVFTVEESEKLSRRLAECDYQKKKDTHQGNQVCFRNSTLLPLAGMFV